jgi:hypothetical protein
MSLDFECQDELRRRLHSITTTINHSQRNGPGFLPGPFLLLAGLKFTAPPA